MTRTRTTAVTLAALLTLAACSSDSEPEPEPSAPTESPTLSADEAHDACVEAVAQRGAETDGDLPYDPRPDACAPLTEDQYMDAYMDGLANANEAGRDALQDCLDDPNCTDW